MDRSGKYKIMVDYLDNIKNDRGAPSSKSNKYSPIGIKWRDWDNDWVLGHYQLEDSVVVETYQVFADNLRLCVRDLPDTKKEIIKYVDSEVKRKAKRLLKMMKHEVEVFEKKIWKETI